MSERYTLVACKDSSSPYGILDLDNGEVALFFTKNEAVEGIDYLNFKVHSRDTYLWNLPGDVYILGGLVSTPALNKPKFVPFQYSDIDGGIVEVVPADYEDLDAGTFIKTSRSGVNVCTSHAPALASAILRACGLDPATTKLPVK